MAGRDRLSLTTRTNHTPVQTLMVVACKIHLLVLLPALVSLSTGLMVVRKILPSQLDPAHLCKVADLVLQHRAWVDNSRA